MKRHVTTPMPNGERDERLYDERVRVIRTGRIIAGLAMIGIAIIWLALENLHGATEKQPGAGAAGPPSPSIPMVGAAQSFRGGKANVIVQTRPTSFNGRLAPAGSSFLVIAVQVMNRTSSALHVTSSDFTWHLGTRNTGSGIAVAGHSAVFSPVGLRPGATADGDIEFTPPTTSTPLVIEYLPQFPGAAPLRWSAPSAGR